MTYFIEVKLTGENVTPLTLSSADLAKMLISVEELVAALIETRFPHLNLEEGEIVVGLTEIVHGSYTTRFKTNYANQAHEVMPLIGDALLHGNMGELPDDALTQLVELQRLTRKHRCNIQFSDVNGTRRELGELTTHTEIALQRPTVESHDVLYGKVIRIGGETPRVKLHLLTGEDFTCRITEVDGNRVAKQLAKQLYTLVGVEGRATRDSRTMRLKDFMIEGLLPYRDVSPREAFEDVANSVKSLIEPMGKDAYLQHLALYGEDW
jgi:hypothetical protein